MTNRQVVERALQLVSDDEFVRIDALLEKSLNSEKKYAGAEELIPLLKSDSLSHACKSVALYIFQAWRIWSDSSLVESVSAFKNLAWLRKKIDGLGIYRKASNPASFPGQECSAPMHAGNHPHDFTREGIIKVYQLCLGRSPVEEEIAIWKKNFADGLEFPQFLCGLFDCPEGLAYKKSKELLSGSSDGQFIQYVYDSIHGRGCTALEIQYWEQQLRFGAIQRADVLSRSFVESVSQNSTNSAPNTHDGLSCQIMGTTQHVTITDWENKARELESTARCEETSEYRSSFYIKSEPKVLVSAIASLYRGGKFIEQFLENITSQSCFSDYCELVIIDANSPENESQTIERFCKQHKNIVYRRMDHRIGIYDAWNIGAEIARGDYLTNTNLDDLRSNDSLELQAAVLDNLPFVDVVYQDFYYTFDPRLSLQEIARFSYKSNLPFISVHNMMAYNSPHNAPMWRKRLHDELGYFDISYKSAGDYEFWMRCLAANKVFYKINDPHVVYYQNPEGLSTRPDSRGVEEAKRIHKTYAKQLISKNVVLPIEDYLRSLNLKNGSQRYANTKESRYTLAQRALREAAVRGKYSNPHTGIN